MPQDISPEDAHYRRICNAEQRLAVLRDLTELGMALTQNLVRRTLDDSAEPAAEAASAPRRDPADAFARLSRAIRLTLALEAKSEDQLAVLRAGGTTPTATTPPAPTRDPAPRTRDQPYPGDHPCARRNRVRNAVFDTVDREVLTDFELAQDMLKTTHEDLAEGGQFEAFAELPLKDAVEAVFRHFRREPDFSRWTEDSPPPSTQTPRQIWERFWPPPDGPRLE